ncbi:type I-E CRISPR-associated protein Cas6/Cse3/CasE [bacterium]|nr:type I-E CRISPR-associated protein Cas6/Cse3/CasE [candidate division CSSED10-310 bacterium]
MKTINLSHLFLSRLELDPRSRRVMKELADPYEMHRTLMHAFPDLDESSEPSAREKFGVLFRPEMDIAANRIRVYVQSLEEPDWLRLEGIEQYMLRVAGRSAHECKDIMPACRLIRSGQVLAFRVRANPTRRVARMDDPMKGKRVELNREDAQIAWFERKGMVLGFEVPVTEKIGGEGITWRVPSIRVMAEGKQQGRKQESGRRHTMTHLAVVFEGLIRITNADVFLQTLARGVGPGKAFGCGLLSVAPAGMFG